VARIVEAFKSDEGQDPAHHVSDPSDCAEIRTCIAQRFVESGIRANESMTGTMFSLN